MSTIDKILFELNQCRSSPIQYSSKLSKLLRYYRGNIFSRPGYDPIETEEGAANVLSCISYLKSVCPVPKLIESVPLHQAAQIHADDIGTSGRMSHIGEDGSEPSDRIERFCQWSGHLGENIDYGNDSPEDIVTSLLIDDGLPARGQRLNIMKREHKYVGIGFGYHKEYQYVCVIIFAELVIENSSVSPSISSARKMKKSEYVKVKEITEVESKVVQDRRHKLIETIRDSYDCKDLTDDDIIEIKEYFDSLSRRDRTISITNIKQPPGDASSDVIKVLGDADPVSIAHLDFEGLLSFVAGNMKKQKTVSRKVDHEAILELKEIFDLVDVSKSEVIKKQDINSAIKSKKLANYNSTILDLMNCIDDQKGDMSFEEFIEVISNKEDPSQVFPSYSEPYSKAPVPRSQISSYEILPNHIIKKNFNPARYAKPGITEEQVIEIKKAFDLFDIEKKGLISAQDIKMAMKGQGFKKKNPTVYQIVSELGGKIKSELDFDDFFYLLTERNIESPEENEIKKFFDLFDREKLGYIELKNLKSVARELGESLDEEDIVDLIRKSDLDGDGKVTYTDFYKIMSNAF